MRYYAMYTENGDLMCIGEGPGGVEITKAEYDTLYEEIMAAAPPPPLYESDIDEALALMGLEVE